MFRHDTLGITKRCLPSPDADAHEGLRWLAIFIMVKSTCCSMVPVCWIDQDLTEIPLRLLCEKSKLNPSPIRSTRPVSSLWCIFKLTRNSTCVIYQSIPLPADNREWQAEKKLRRDWDEG